MGDVIDFAKAAMRRRIQRAEANAVSGDTERRLKSIIARPETQKDFKARIHSLLKKAKWRNAKDEWTVDDALDDAKRRMSRAPAVEPPAIVVIVRTFEEEMTRTRYFIYQSDSEITQDMLIGTLEDEIGSKDEDDDFDDNDPFAA